MKRTMYSIPASPICSVYVAEPIYAEQNSGLARCEDRRGATALSDCGPWAAVILLHGFAETSRMWRPLIPLLAEKFTVIAPDLPGIGDSSIPTDKIDMMTSANRIHALVHSLGDREGAELSVTILD